MIVRILGDGQYDVADSAVEQLNELDAAVDQALAGGDDAGFGTALDALTSAVRAVGSKVDPTVILPSDLVLPHEGASLAEVRELLDSEDVEY